MEDEGDDTKATRVRNDKAFEAAPLSGANASWQRERWGDRMTDHGEEEHNNDNVNIAAITIVTAALNATINRQ